MREVELPPLTERQALLVQFALHRFASDARAQANWAAQKTSEAPFEAVKKFLADAKDAEDLLTLFRHASAIRG